MAGVRVVTDSSCDLPDDIVTELGIDVVPLTIRFGDEEFVDRRDLTPKEFWARSAASAVLPETAAPAPGAFEEAYRRAGAAGADSVVAVCLSSKLSATFQSAQLGAKALQDELRIDVIDSESVTMGLGQMAVDAARMARDGASVDEIGARVRDLVDRTRVYGALDTLDNLKKGGRVGGAQALIGSMLSIKPIIEVRDGQVEPESKQRTRSRALQYLLDKVRTQGTIDSLAMMHGDAPDADEFLDRLAEFHPREDIIVGEIGAVIGAHAGPRVIGVVFQVPR
jgi:DegV family protein with EDD domain